MAAPPPSRPDGRIDPAYNIYRVSTPNEPGGAAGAEQIPHLQFGHYTNRVLRLYRYYSASNDEHADTFSIENPETQMTVLALFFSLYDYAWDVNYDRVYALNQGIKTIIQEGHNIKFNDAGTPNLNIGYLLRLLHADVRDATTDAIKRQIRQNIANDLSRYFGSQLLYLFLIGTGQFGLDRGVRIYFDQRSLDLLRNVHGDLTFTLNYKSILSHYIRDENERVWNKWNMLCRELENTFVRGIGIRIRILEEPNTLPEKDYRNIALNPTIKNIEITFTGTSKQRLAAIVKLYQVFIMYDELDIDLSSNSKLEFYTYQFEHPAYLQTYEVRLNRVSGMGDAIIRCSLTYHVHQGFICQAFRYIALSQTNYRLRLPRPGGAALEYDIRRPTHIHIRDSHHGCPTKFENALMQSVFAPAPAADGGVLAPSPRYFFTTGPEYKRAWHTIWTQYGAGTPYVKFDQVDIDQDAYGTPQGNSTRSVWAGLQSFYKAPGDEPILDIPSFQQTMGLIFHHHEMTLHQRTLFYGINQHEGHNNFYFLCYGIDERLLARFFYPNVLASFNAANTFTGETHLTAAQHVLIRDNMRTTRNVIAGSLESLSRVIRNSYVYVIDVLGYNMYTKNMNNVLFGRQNIYTNDLDTVLAHINANTPPYHQNDVRHRVLRALLDLFAYIIMNKSFPKTQYEIIKGIELFRNSNYPSIGFVHNYLSMYNYGDILFRSINPGELNYNKILAEPTNTQIQALINYFKQSAAGVINPNIRQLEAYFTPQFGNYVHDIKTFIKMNDANRCDGTLMDGVHGKNRGHAKYGKCATQPYNFVGAPRNPYQYRGLADLPPHPYPTAMIGGGRKHSKKLKQYKRRRTMRGGGSNNNSKNVPFSNVNGVVSKNIVSNTNISKTMNADIETFLHLLSLKDALSKEEIASQRPAGIRVLAACIKDRSMFDTLLQYADKLYPYKQPAFDSLYDEIPTNMYTHMRIQQFISSFKEYIASFNNSDSAVEYFDIHFDLEGKPALIHISSVIDRAPLPYIPLRPESTNVVPAPIFKNDERVNVQQPQPQPQLQPQNKVQETKQYTLQITEPSKLPTKLPLVTKMPTKLPLVTKMPTKLPLRTQLQTQNKTNRPFLQNNVRHTMVAATRKTRDRKRRRRTYKL